MSENIQKAKQGFGNILSKIGTASRGKGKDKNSPLSQISYFEVDDKTNKYVRVYATLVSLEPYKLQVKIGSDVYSLPSAVDLTGPGCMIANILRFFAFAPDPTQYKQLFPLPASALTPPAEAAHIEFPKQTDKEREATIEAHPAVKAARKEYEAAKSEFTAALRDVANFVGEQAKLGKAAPGMQGLLGAGAAEKVVANVQESEEPATKALRPQVAIAPPKGSPASGPKAPKRAIGSKVKVSKRRKKDHESITDRLFRVKE